MIATGAAIKYDTWPQSSRCDTLKFSPIYYYTVTFHCIYKTEGIVVSSDSKIKKHIQIQYKSI